MSARTQCNGLSVATELYDLINDEIAPGAGVDADKFWSEFSAIINEFSNNKFVGIQLTKENLFRNEDIDGSSTSQFREDISILGAADFNLRYGVERDDTI